MHVKASCSSSCMWIGGMNMPWLYKVLVYYVCEKSRYLCYGSNFIKIPGRATGSFKISCFKVSTLCSISLWLILRLTSSIEFHRSEVSLQLKFKYWTESWEKNRKRNICITLCHGGPWPVNLPSNCKNVALMPSCQRGHWGCSWE